MNDETQPFILLTLTFFYRNSANFAVSGHTDTDWILVHNL